MVASHNIKNLSDLKDLLRLLSKEQYSRKMDVLSGASIGQHVRHILEFYECLLNSSYLKEICYDERKRDLVLESEVSFAIKTIDHQINLLLDLREDKMAVFKVNYSPEINSTGICVKTSLYRELAYNLEHSIHHQALIRIAVMEMDLNKLLRSDFGVAPSTIRYRTSSCAQ